MSERRKLGIVFKLLPVEKVILLYIFLTGLLEISFYSKLPGVSIHLFYRLVLVFVVLILAAYGNYQNKKSIKTVRIFFPFLLLGFFYIETDYLNNLFSPENLDPLISGWETFIFGFQPALSFAGVFHSNVFAELMYFGYISYFILYIGIPLYIYLKVSETLGEKFSFIVIASFLAYYIFFIIFPVGGPQFYHIEWSNKLPEGYIFGPVLRLMQDYGEGATAAFPSSHVSISIILLIGSYIYAKKLVKIILPFIIILLFSTVYIRAHYVIDTIAGALLAPFLFWLTSKFYKTIKREAEVSIEIIEPTKKSTSEIMI